MESVQGNGIAAYDLARGPEWCSECRSHVASRLLHQTLPECGQCAAAVKDMGGPWPWSPWRLPKRW